MSLVRDSSRSISLYRTHPLLTSAWRKGANFRVGCQTFFCPSGVHSLFETSYNKDMICPVRWLHLFIVLLSGGLLWADTAAFDLAGPRIEVRVTRAGKTLPISRVPNLQVGDRLWIHPDMPDGESVRFLMISVFLRGSTNPPPEAWFTRA